MTEPHSTGTGGAGMPAAANIASHIVRSGVPGAGTIQPNRASAGDVEPDAAPPPGERVAGPGDDRRAIDEQRRLDDVGAGHGIAQCADHQVDLAVAQRFDELGVRPFDDDDRRRRMGAVEGGDDRGQQAGRGPAASHRW